MRVLLAGQKSFGLAAYEAIQDAGHDVVGVWSPLGVDKATPFAQSADKLTRRAERDGLWTGELGRNSDMVGKLGVDLVVAAHSHDFISRKVREATKFGAIGYHPSLLPRHRGRDAVRWTIRMGDPVTGGTVYWLNDNVDGGPIAAQEHVLMPRMALLPPDDGLAWLWRERLFPLGIQLLLDVLFDIQNGTIIEVPQEENCATWEPSWERPPLFRPDLPQLGSGIPGMTHITSRNGAHTWRSIRDMKGAV